jgi:hypothetical protein
MLSDFGDAAGWLIAAFVLFAYGRRTLPSIVLANNSVVTRASRLLPSGGWPAEAAATDITSRNTHETAAIDASDPST